VTMRPRLQILPPETIERVVAEAYDLLSDPGVRVHSDRALHLLAEHGASGRPYSPSASGCPPPGRVSPTC